MLATQMGEHIKNSILAATSTVWSALNIESVTADSIWNDLARYGLGGIEATFYIKGLDNVVRKDFNTQAAALKASNPLIEEFKVKYKRPDKEVRFYIKINKQTQHDQQAISEQAS